jgi:hypothetical protein
MTKKKRKQGDGSFVCLKGKQKNRPLVLTLVFINSTGTLHPKQSL